MMINQNFSKADAKWGPDDKLLYAAQKNWMSTVLETILQTSDGKRFNRKHKKDPKEVWRLHEEHQRSSATNSAISSALSQELAQMKVSEFTSSSQFLDEFDSKLEQFNELNLGAPMPEKMAIGFLLSASHGNTELRNAWATKRTICQNAATPTVPSYSEYFEYLMFHSKQLEASVIDNSAARKANTAETNYLSHDSPSDPDYQQADDLSSIMGVQDADFIQHVLECNKAMNERKPPPRQRNQRQPVREELKIKDGWDEMTREHKREWQNATASVKEKILAQRQAKSSGPPTKNHQLPTGKRVVYRMVLADDEDDNGYFSDRTANSETTYDFNASSALVYDATDNGNSDG